MTTKPIELTQSPQSDDFNPSEFFWPMVHLAGLERVASFVLTLMACGRAVWLDGTVWEGRQWRSTLEVSPDYLKEIMGLDRRGPGDEST